MPLLPTSDLEAFLTAHPEWPLEDGKLTRPWTFPDFPAAIIFVNQIAALAEQADHHPDVDIRYNRVTLALISHDAGGITSRDARMATSISTHFPSDSDGDASVGLK